jgi:hypothetical protein
MHNLMRELAFIVGGKNLVNAPDALEQFVADRGIAPKIAPRSLVRPQTAAQVQQLVQWANKNGTPLIPVSSGSPHFNGDTVPSVAEAVIVDLSLMNRILKIDRRNKMVVVEPGVTYPKLDAALAKAGLRIPRPLQPRPNKSVLASLLERQPTTIPRLNYSLPEPLRVCGVVWGTGDLSFTGEAAMGPLSLEAQWKAGLAQVNQQGPMSTDLMRLLTGAQGTMGIVVWASIKCQLLPAASKRFIVSANKLEDLIEFSRKIERLKLGDEIIVLNQTRLASATQRPAKSFAPWSILLGASGAAFYPQERVDLQEKELKSAAAEFSLKLKNADEDVSALMEGCTAPTENHHDIFFLCPLDAAPTHVQNMMKIAAQMGYSPERLGVYIQPQHQGISQHVEFTIAYDPDNKKDAELAFELYTVGSESLISNGAYFSRPYGPWADLVYTRDATAVRVLKTVKKIVDPNNVMNPGKLCF